MAFIRKIEVIAGPEGGEGFSVTENFITFDITKSNKKSMNKATIQIYNLSDDTMNIMKRRDNLILIRAGYEDETINDLFVGNIVHSSVKRERVDKVLEIEAHDGQRSLMTRTVSLGFDSRVAVTTVLNNIFSVLAYPVVGRERIPAGEQYNNGYAFAGYARKALEEVLEKVGLKYSVQNEQIFIYKEDDEAVQTTGLLLSPETGLLSLDPKEERKKRNTTQQKAEYSAKSLLFPQLIPGAQIQIKKGKVDTFFVVQSGVYKGDNQRGEFTAEIEVKEI